MNWTLTLGFLYFSMVMGGKIFAAADVKPKLFPLLISSLLSSYVSVLLTKWVFNHGLAIIFGFSHLHFQEALFLDLFLTMFVPTTFKKVIVEKE